MKSFARVKTADDVGRAAQVYFCQDSMCAEASPAECNVTWQDDQSHTVINAHIVITLRTI